MRRLGSLVFWSVISAAFIGPGTVATAAAAGARHDHRLLWALVFSTVACLVLQEAAARLTLVSGADLGQTLRRQYPSGMARLAVLVLVLGAIVVGCAAYEAGNILGGAAALTLAADVSPRAATVAIGAAAALLLWLGRVRTVARALALLVGVMGLAFLVTAWRLKPSAIDVLRGSVWPGLPQGSGVLVLGLVGTTVVPYNLFLGSGIARGQRLSELRFGLSLAILLGGVISMGVVVVGSAVKGDLDFEALSTVLVERLGHGAGALFAAGLFAAGFSSAVTAPLAAAITARSLFGTTAAEGANDRRWGEHAWRYRATWGGVLATGVAFGLLDVRPIPVIVAAQALNGLLLPLVAAYLLRAVNDGQVMGRRSVNPARGNLALGVVCLVCLVLGLANLGRAGSAALGLRPPGEGALVAGAGILAALGAIPMWRVIARVRKADRE